MAVFPLLANPDDYRACASDLLEDESARRYWLDCFVRHLDVQLTAAARDGVTDAACVSARAEMTRAMDLIRETPDRHGRLDLLVLDDVRRVVLHGAGIVDEFRRIKERENEAALAALPAWLARIDAMAGAAQLEMLVRGILAGNLFDMGANETASRYAEATPAFEDALASVADRPWRYDDLDRVEPWLRDASPRRAVLFADNAGADIVLGVLPLARHLVRSGVDVVVTANHGPSLNDVTIDELRALVARMVDVDPSFASPRLRLVDAGSTAPLVDLTRIGATLADAAHGTDLVVLVGMGRAIESNWSASFTCATWRIAMIKDTQVARIVDAALFDAVCRFDAAS